MAIGTLNYKLNKWTMFSFEESLFTTHANHEEPLPLFRGVPSREWNDVRGKRPHIHLLRPCHRPLRILPKRRG